MYCSAALEQPQPRSCCLVAARHMQLLTDSSSGRGAGRPDNLHPVAGALPLSLALLKALSHSPSLLPMKDTWIDLPIAWDFLARQ